MQAKCKKPQALVWWATALALTLVVKSMGELMSHHNTNASKVEGPQKEAKGKQEVMSSGVAGEPAFRLRLRHIWTPTHRGTAVQLWVRFPPQHTMWQIFIWPF